MAAAVRLCRQRNCADPASGLVSSPVAEIIDLDAAVALARDGDHVLIGGSGGGHAVPEAWIAALAERFRATGRPRGLSLMSVVAIGDWKTTGFEPPRPAGSRQARGVGGLQQLPGHRRDGGRRRDRGVHAAPGGAVPALPGHGGRPPGPADADRPPHLRRPAPGRRQAERPDDGGPGRARDAPRRGVPLLPRPADRPRGDPRHHRRRAGQRHHGGRALLRRAALHRPGRPQSRGDRRLPGLADRRGGDAPRQAGEGPGRAGGLPRRRARRVADLRHPVRPRLRGRDPAAGRGRSRGCRSTSARSSRGGRRSSSSRGRS